ncbi:hypothetical protein BKA65DRAFT_63534 [Rhexocercosporidium sp. MPI-PUGE-AT-0058]|nr:hypothetical protein BKA65DRAFT_63534 [Rhexocercosporidium sp. MPI-PUGE-AT-0058]
MHFSRLATVAALSLISFTSASPIDTRDAMSCKVDVATTQATCINDVPVGVDGEKDSEAVTQCFTAAFAGLSTCPGAEKRDVATCETKVMSAQTTCVKAISPGSDGTMDPKSVLACSSTALKGLNSCISARKLDRRDLEACADAVTAKQGDCLLAAGTDQKKVSKCSADAYRGFVACV